MVLGDNIMSCSPVLSQGLWCTTDEAELDLSSRVVRASKGTVQGEGIGVLPAGWLRAAGCQGKVNGGNQGTDHHHPLGHLGSKGIP